MEPYRPIEGFRRQEVTDGKDDQVSRIFVEEGRQARRALYVESEDLRQPFDKTRVERNVLRKALDDYKESISKKAPKEAIACLESCKDFKGLTQSLINVRQQWTEKKRLFRGKGQDYFHKLCRTLDGHKTILDAFPDSNEYVSIFCAAFNTTVQASLNHQKTAERLVVDLEQINEAVEMAAESVALFNIEATRVRFANLYSHIFHFFVEAIAWYSASSSVKLMKSLNSNYNEKFDNIIGAILTIKSSITDKSSLGSMAEIRDIHLSAELTTENVIAIRRLLEEHIIGAEGQARVLAEKDAQNFELRQENAIYQRQIAKLSNAISRRQISEGIGSVLESMILQNPDGTMGTALPRTPVMTVENAPTPDKYPGKDQSKTAYDRDTLLRRAEAFQNHIHRGQITESLLDSPQFMALPNAMFGRLRDWISSDACEMLWIRGPTDQRYPSKMSVTAATIIRLFAKAEPTVIFHFCDLPSTGELHNDTTAEEVGIVNLIYSLVQQLVLHLRPNFESYVDFSEQRFAALNGSIQSVTGALDLLLELVPLCLPYIIFVIDGLERLDYGRGLVVCEHLLDVLRELSALDQEDAESKSVYKVLFTTSGTSGTLMRSLEAQEILLQDDRRSLLHDDRLTLGKTAITDLENSS